MPSPSERAALNAVPIPVTPRLSIFWRTFAWLASLLMCNILAWSLFLNVLEFEPHAAQIAQQMAALVRLSRTAWLVSEPAARDVVVSVLANQERLQLRPRLIGETWEKLPETRLNRRIAELLSERLGYTPDLAESVNGHRGWWIGLSLSGQAYWLRMEEDRFKEDATFYWPAWLTMATILSLGGAALVARHINRPIQALSFAASRVRDGDFDASHLDERVATSEIREVNIGFNRMAQRLAQLDQERAVMLAGISHDLRTPLARMRLEAEMSVSNDEARENMVADIEQLDAIIDKFMDYARPEPPALAAVRMEEVIQTAVQAYRSDSHVRIRVDVQGDPWVYGDAVELGRVLANLLENARRYGRTPGTNVAQIHLSARPHEAWVLLWVRDKGPGVRKDQLPLLTKPFYRGDTARTAATGAGLGLSIVEKTLARMGGSFALVSHPDGGLGAHIRLRKYD